PAHHPVTGLPKARDSAQIALMKALGTAPSEDGE
ncbi:MAG: hypothetical protein QOH03_4852, partial [Kribbellaceae bacterium]|nr:hypothetical protein [Kribbellaceae bacterium]